MKQKSILIISKDNKITDMLIMHLEAEGCLVNATDKSSQGVIIYKEKLHDLIVIDMATADSDCIELACQLRDIQDTSIVFLTEEDKQHGISLDIVKSKTDSIDIKNIDELMYLVAEQFSLHERKVIEKQEKGRYQCGSLIISIKTKEAWINGEKLNLSDMTMNLLIFMVLNEDNYISKKELYQQVWKNPVSENDSTVMAHIRNLRRELGDNNVSNPLYIHTKRGVGYMFKCTQNK